MDAEMRHLSREALEPSRGQQEAKIPRPQREELVCSERSRRAAAWSSSPCVHAQSLLSWGCCSQEDFQPHILGGHKQLQGKDNKLQTQDKISMIPLEVFLLCCCKVLIKACAFRYYDLKNQNTGSALWRALWQAAPRLAHGHQASTSLPPHAPILSPLHGPSTAQGIHLQVFFCSRKGGAGLV